jgi:nucleoid DNA-binding protein
MSPTIGVDERRGTTLIAQSQSLFAWARPISKRNKVEHTWITTYDSGKTKYLNIAQVTAAKELYWYCWGDFHSSGRLLGTQVGDVQLANCYVEPNANSRTIAPARGTIFSYALDGVCHQLANQVLYSTISNGQVPLTVEGAVGYRSSTYIYGMYGLQHEAWAAKIASCSGTKRLDISELGDPAMTGEPDDFERRAREVLEKRNPKLLAELLILRSAASQKISELRPTSVHLSAQQINARNQRLFDKAAELLGPKLYKEIFEFSPSEKIDLVESTIANPTKIVRDRLPMSQAMRSAGKLTTPTVTLKHLAAALAETHEMSKKQAEAVLGDFIGNIVKHLKKGERIRIGGLGILQVRKRAARMGRNPSTGEHMNIRAGRKIAFRAAKDLKEVI